MDFMQIYDFKMNEDIRIVAELDIHQSKILNDYVSFSYPWLPSRMDFSRIPNHSHLNWGSATDIKVQEFILASMSDFSNLAILYSEKEPISIVEIGYAAIELGYLSKARQIFLAFGASKIGGDWVVEKTRFLYVHTGFDIWCVS